MDPAMETTKWTTRALRVGGSTSEAESDRTNQPAPPPSTPEVDDQDIVVWDLREELLDLISCYGRHALFVTHHTWKPLIRSISTKLLDSIHGVEDPEHTQLSDAASVAFLVLPGVIRAVQKFQLGRPIDYLHQWNSLPNAPAASIVKAANDIRRKVEEHLRYKQLESREAAGRREEPSAEQKRQIAIRRQTQRIERLVFEGRIGAAALQVDHLDELLVERAVVQEPTPQATHPAVPPRAATAGAGPDAVPTPRDTPRLSREQASVLLRKYNPRGRPEEDALEAWADPAPPLHITVKEVQRAIQKSNSHSAAGYTPWTFALVKALTSDRAPTDPFLHAITRLFNLMLSNRVRRDYWVPSRAVLLPKGDTAWRPLGIGECWYRLLGKAAMIKIGQAVGKELLPPQLGVGMKGGSEIAGLLAQVMLDSDPAMAIINLDIANAFNTIPRNRMWKGVREKCPALGQWFQWAYGAPTELRLSDGSVACLSETGSRQGDPLASMIFCLGFHYALRELSSRLTILNGDLPPPLHPEETDAARAARDALMIERGEFYHLQARNQQDNVIDDVTGMAATALVQYFRQRMDNPARMGLVAYMDDCNVFLPRTRLSDVSDVILEVFASSGLTLNVNKCQVLYGSHPPQNAPRCPFPIQRESALSMGVPTGPLQYRQDKIRKMLDQMQVLVRSMAHLSALAGFAIVRFCGNTRAGYLARVTDVFEMREHFDRFDCYVDTVLRAIIEADLGLSPISHTDLQFLRNHMAADRLLNQVDREAAHGGVAWTTADDPTGATLRHAWIMESVLPRLRGLPLHLGGLGVVRHGGVAGDQAGCMSRKMTKQFVHGHEALNYLRRGILKWTPIQLGMAEQLRGDVLPFIEPRAPHNEEMLEDAEAYQITDEVVTVYQNIHIKLLTELTQHNLDAQRAFLLSATYDGSGKWLNSSAMTGMYYGPYRFQPAEFREALRLRCLVNPLPVDVTAGGSRFCICGKDVSQEMTHCLDCNRFTTSHVSARHDACREALITVVKAHMAMDETATFQRETMVGVGQHQRRADVVINLAKFHRPLVLDMAVADPAAPFYREKVDSHKIPGAAAAYHAEEKRRQYREVGIRVILFVLEATGRPGKDALEFLAAIGDDQGKELVTRFLSLSCCMS